MYSTTNDHEIMIGTEIKGLQLYRDADGKAAYSVFEQEAEHRGRVLFGQYDWKHGFGQYQSSNPSKYLSGQNIETSMEGRVTIGPHIQVSRIFEYPDSVKLDDGGAFATETSDASNWTASDVTLLPATPAENDAFYIGDAAKFNEVYISIGTLGAGTWTITWEYWNGSAWTAISSTEDFKSTVGIVLTGMSNWATCEVDGVTLYWIRGRVSAYTSITTQPLGSTVWIVKSTPHAIEIDARTQAVGLFPYFSYYIAHGLTLYAVYDLSYALFEVCSLPVNITSMVFYDDVLYLGQGSSDLYYYSTDGKVFTQTDLTDGYAEHFLIAPNPDATGTVLWKSKLPNEVSSTTNGKTVAAGGIQWASPAYIGDTHTDITNLILHSDKFLIGKTDRLWYYDSNGGTSVFLENLNIADSSEPENFASWVSHQGSTYFTLNGRLVELTSYDGITFMGPNEESGKIEEFSEVFDVVSDGKFLYAGVYDNTTRTEITIYKGYIDLEAWHWCPIVSTTGTTVSKLAINQSYSSMFLLYFLRDTTHIYNVSLESIPFSGNLFNDTWDTKKIRFSWDYGTDIYMNKILESIVVETSDCSATQTIIPYYYKDTDTVPTQMAEAITTNGVNKINLTTPIYGKRFSFEFVLTSNSTLTSPVLRKFQALGSEKPESVRIHDCSYTLGHSPYVTAKTIRTFLRGGRTTTSLIKFADLRFGEHVSGTGGTDFTYVTMAPGYPQEVEMTHAITKEPELVVKVRWIETNYS